jgi:hypothetical protein
VTPAVLADVLAPVDARVRARTELRTLGPSSRASLPSELVAAALRPDDAPALHDAVARGTALVVGAMLDAFPCNLLWDLDLLVATQATLARRGWDVSLLFERIAGLQPLFGEQGTIRFRYIHDFLYGFDWARWVKKAPEQRGDIGPYDPAFIERMTRRGHELEDAIASGKDAKYPPLPDGRTRNPFGFSREPPDELRLHRALASAGELPVAAWAVDGRVSWDRDFGELRREMARRLLLHTSS